MDRKARATARWRETPRVNVDIVGDYAGKNLFGIHGDALLSYCLQDSKVDFSPGFQLLHAVHAVETLLSKLEARGCRFQVFWFDNAEISTTNSDHSEHMICKYQLTRTVLIQHFIFAGLGRQDQKGEQFSFSFPSPASGEFLKHLDSHAFSFFLGSDGTTSCLGEDPAVDKENGRLFHFLLHMHSAGRPVALFENIKFKSSKVYVYMCPPRGDHAPLELEGVGPFVRTTPDAREKLASVLKVSNDAGLTAREAVTLYALSALLTSGDLENARSHARNAAAVLVHLLVLRHCPLSKRSLPDQEPSWVPSKQLQFFILRFCRASYEALRGWFEGDGASLKWDCFDLFDGRLFLSLRLPVGRITCPSEFAKEFARLSGLLRDLSSVDVSKYYMVLHGVSDVSFGEENPVGEDTAKTPALSSCVLPFAHPVLDQYLTEVRLETNAEEPSSNAPKIFQELTHWHNAKKALDPKRPQKPKGFFARRRDQRFMADTIAYSASLTGASGKNIDPEIIVVTGISGAITSAARKSEPTQKPKLTHNPKVKTRPAVSGKERALESARLQNAQKTARKSDAIIVAWGERYADFEKVPWLSTRYLKVEKYLTGLSQDHIDVVGAEVSLYLCNILWMAQGASQSPKMKYSILALLWYRMMDTLKFSLTGQVLSGLSAFAEAFQVPLGTMASKSLPMRSLPFKAVDGSIRKALPTTHPVEFQLEFCGPYLERSFDSAPDSRVPFDPDAWQRKVLDAIDARRSLLVVAPTSAGKTFISFYAMKTVLQSNDDDVIVYVAPTKALVNQIAAEVQARFTKSYRHPGRSVWSIHTRDYRVNNPQGCQVLVTVPSILQILLLAPSNCQNEKSFSRCIKWIIFDEVHSIGQSDEGIIWEQLLLMAPCPIIALSATIGNILEFRDWLRDVQEVKGLDFEMVVHSSRYSDLRKFYHNPTPSLTEFTGLTPIERFPVPGLDSGPGSASPFLAIHPVAAIVDRTSETLDDTSLEPSDCLSLWKCMSKHQNDRPGYQINGNLGPEQTLPGVVRKSDIVLWETALKEELSKWITDPKSPFRAIQQELRGARWLEMLAAHSEGLEDPPPKPAGGSIVSSDSVFSLVLDLRANGALPAILFNYDRVKCEAIVLDILTVLKSAETKFREEDAGWASKMTTYEKWKSAKGASKATTAKSSATRQRRRGGDDEEKEGKSDRQRDEASREASKWDNFDPNAPLPEFNLADTTKMSQAEFQERVETLDGDSVPQHLIEALRRGLGVHHAGMNRGYRQVVEILFRKGYLTVVVATGTLAMGINMPCKTVVFTGDSVYLTALNYRQASGRAGRRGFDLLGNVVLHDMAPHRAFDIMSARLPDLRGQFPVSVTLVLRLFILLHGTGNSAFARDIASALLTQNRLYLGGPSARMSIAHHLRFTIDYLRRQHLLSKSGAPLNFSGLVGHLYYTENAVFAFHALLKEGYFHDICARVDEISKQQDILLEIVLALCHLFCRTPCLRYQDQTWLQRVVKRSSSLILLPNLPPRAAKILEDHNQQVLDIFRGYVGSYASQHLSNTPDDELPYTKVKVRPSNPLELGSIMASALPPTSIRSPFAALSGFTDEFQSIHDLCATVRGDVFLEESAIPYIPIAPKETNGVPWNSYLFDFFKHGDLRALVRDNGIKHGNVWFHLKDFSLVLATIVASLSNFLDPNSDENDVEIGLNDEMDSGDLGEDGYVDEDMGKARSKTKEKGVGNPSVTGKKKVVADSWDDENNEDLEDCSGAERAGGDVADDVADSRSSTWAQDDWKSLKKVYQAFLMIQAQFEEKFRKIGA